MDPLDVADLYSPDEIARAAGVSVAEVLAVFGEERRYATQAEAVDVGRAVLSAGPMSPRLDHIPRSPSASLAVSSSLHVLVLGATLVLTAGLVPTAAVATNYDMGHEPMRLVFLATPGPGGGGGGGGLRQPLPPPKALRQGRNKTSSPVPEREPPPRELSVPNPEPPKPPVLDAEPLPPVAAPVITVPADDRSRVGVLQSSPSEAESRGAGRSGGVGTGTGTGVGEGDGAGIGPGSGGGTGGGPYRPGSGVTPPVVVHEVRADYTDEARRRGISGEVDLEIVVRRDGTVGDVKVLKGLGGGLNDRAVQAVRQWRFTPANLKGTPVDVLVEVSIEFKLR